MALGRIEAIYAATGHQVRVEALGGFSRDHAAWHHHPAYNPQGHKRITDGGGSRPYIERWEGSRIIFNHAHRPRAGRMALTDEEKNCWRFGRSQKFAVLAPNLKESASPNKQWGVEKWAQVIEKFPIPVFQLTGSGELLPGARFFHTPTFRHAAAVIARASLVLCNEGGNHHMAASMGTPAVVVFGSFVPPLVTGYAGHINHAVETDEGYCGRWEPCAHCKKSMETITVGMVKDSALQLLGR